MRKTILIATIIVVASAILMAAAPGFEVLAKLTVWNRTGSTIYLLLTTPKADGALHYYLTVKPGVAVFTVQRKVYDFTYWSCGQKMTGIADVLTQLSLTFTDCAYLHRWTYTNKYKQEKDTAGDLLWVDPTLCAAGSAGCTGAYVAIKDATSTTGYRYFTLASDGSLTPVAGAAGEVPAANQAALLPKFTSYYTVPQPNIHNSGEPSEEKVHAVLAHWEWRFPSIRCITGTFLVGGNPSTTLGGATSPFSAYQNWGWCTQTDAEYFGIRTYRAPYWQGNYWDSWRVSYDANTARSLHWALRGQTGGYKVNYPYIH